MLLFIKKNRNFVFFEKRFKKMCFNLKKYMVSLAILLTVVIFGCKEENTIVNETDALEWNKKIAKSVVHTQATVISELLPLYSTNEEKIEFIRKSIDSVRFYDDNSGYFYVYNYSCVNIAHATQKILQDSNLYNYTDTKGKYVIRELSAAAFSGGGYVEFYWQKPGSTGEKQKMGYVEPIEGSDYFIGSGVYLE